MTTRVDPKQYTVGGYASTGFSEAELAGIPEKLKQVAVDLARARYPGAPRLAANAMLAAIKLLAEAGAVRFKSE